MRDEKKKISGTEGCSLMTTLYWILIDFLLYISAKRALLNLSINLIRMTDKKNCEQHAKNYLQSVFSFRLYLHKKKKKTGMQWKWILKRVFGHILSFLLIDIRNMKQIGQFVWRFNLNLNFMYFKYIFSLGSSFSFLNWTECLKIVKILISLSIFPCSQLSLKNRKTNFSLI